MEFNGKLVEESEFINSVREGKSTLYGNGWTFTGQFKNGFIEGRGLVKYDHGKE